MSKNTNTLRFKQEDLAQTLSEIEQVCGNEDKYWWHVLMAVNQFEVMHHDYRAMLNRCREFYSSSHWAALLIFNAAAKNEKILNQHISLLRKNLNLVICNSAPANVTTEYLLLQVNNFSQIASDNLKIEHEILSQLLETLYDHESLMQNQL